MREDKKIYSLSIADIQEIAEQDLNRELSENELNLVVDKVGDYINWSEAISYTIEELD